MYSKKKRKDDAFIDEVLNSGYFSIYPTYCIAKQASYKSDINQDIFDNIISANCDKYDFSVDEFCRDCRSFLLHIFSIITGSIKVLYDQEELLEDVLCILKLNTRFVLFDEFRFVLDSWKDLIKTQSPVNSHNFCNTLSSKMNFLYPNMDENFVNEVRSIFFNDITPFYDVFNKPLGIKKEDFYLLYYRIINQYFLVYEKLCIERYKHTNENVNLEYIKKTQELCLNEREHYDLHAKKSEISSRALIIESIKHIENIIKSDKEYSGIPSGFTALDNLTDGYQDGELIIVGARSSMGKTAFAINNAINISENKELSNKKILFFSLEMPALQIGKRIISIKSNIDLLNIRSANLSVENLQDIIRCTNTVMDNIIINDRCALKIEDIDMICNTHKDICCVFIDYLQIIKPDKESFSKVDEIGKISMALKNMAKQYSVPFVVLSQLSRAAEGRENKRPILSDLRDSGSIEQDADTVILLYRDEYYLKRSLETGNQKKNNEIEEKLQQCAGKAEIIIAKQRNGPIDNILLRFDETTGKFDNI